MIQITNIQKIVGALSIATLYHMIYELFGNIEDKTPLLSPTFCNYEERKWQRKDEQNAEVTMGIAIGKYSTRKEQMKYKWLLLGCQ